MATRTVTGTILTPAGAPWDDFPLTFTLQPSTYGDSASYPEETVAVTTDESGAFSVGLVTGVQYLVSYPDIFVSQGSTTTYPVGSRYVVVVPEGEGPIALHDLQALGNQPVATPTAASIIAAWLVEHTATLEDLTAAAQATAGATGPPGPGVPNGGTYGQVLVKTSDANQATAWIDPPGVVMPLFVWLGHSADALDRSGPITVTESGAVRYVEVS